MILVSSVIDTYYRLRLNNKNYRSKTFNAALKNELRHSKIGKIILRNLNEMMNLDTTIHNEFKEIIGKYDYQAKFWESDLGYLWFEGNSNSNKPYFNDVIALINNRHIVSVLDVGCGWGVFCNKCVQETNVARVLGIDISERVIENANAKFRNNKLRFETKDIFQIEEKFELVSIFGSIDYVLPEKIEAFVLKMLAIASKNVVIVNSLRKLSLEDSLTLTASKEIKRYDVGYVHPLNFILEKHRDAMNYNYSIVKSGLDSVYILISK